MATQRSPSRSSTETEPAPAGPAERKAHDLRRLGNALLARSAEVLEKTVAQTVDSGQIVEPHVQESFERICSNSTPAVARWIAGEGIEVTIDSSRETSHMFGELAARRAASLHEVTRRSFWWRNVMVDVLRECAAEMDVCEEARNEALNMVQLSVEFSILRICEHFEGERQRTDVELARREEELAFLATHDPLTGLPNRALILDRLEQMLARAARSQTPVAAMFVDLDNFKSINDTLGHAVGDELLQAVAERLKLVVRAADGLGRLGGDEFVVIAADLTEGGPEILAERLIDALKGPFELRGRETSPLSVTTSVGIAVGQQTSPEELLRDADIAMYRAKFDGRNGYAVFESGMQHALQSRMEIEMDLREALEKEEFFLVYQPTLRLSDMRPSGMEALIRWKHPVRGVVQPDAFIPVLEETGLIINVGRWVLRRACEQAAAWVASGHALNMAVNVSARQLDSDDLIADIEQALRRSGLAPQSLTIEITETALMHNLEETARRLVAIKDLGVRIAIDDFGTGYSSLAHLQRFPVDALKIDRSFIAALDRDRDGASLIRTLVQLGKALSIETFAEGIERRQELEMLRAEACDSGQGFLFARPLDAQAAGAYLRAWRVSPAGAGAGGLTRRG
jgi:diguanylate cyclase (GGDEF)-like protein